MFCPDIYEKANLIRNAGTYSSSCTTLPFRNEIKGKKYKKESVHIVTTCNNTTCATEPINGMASSPHLWVPVYDTQTNLSFINSECALCNNISTIEPWDVFVECIQTDDTTRTYIEMTSVNSSESLKELMDDNVCHIMFDVERTIR